jgi:hypothetical protein
VFYGYTLHNIFVVAKTSIVGASKEGANSFFLLAGHSKKIFR